MGRTLTYAVLFCGGCGKSWEQPVLANDSDEDWHVCPHCLHAAPVAPKETP